MLLRSLPQVSYLTSLDQYVLVCFSFMLLAALENVIYPAYLAQRERDGAEDGTEVSEYAIVISLTVLFTVVNLMWGGLVFHRDRKNRSVLRDVRLLERILRAASKKAYSQRNEVGECPRKLARMTSDFVEQGVKNAGGRIQKLFGQNGLAEGLLSGGSYDRAQLFAGAGKMAEEEEHQVLKWVEGITPTSTDGYITAASHFAVNTFDTAASH